MNHKNSNSKKSKNGYDFNREVKNILLDKLNNKDIKSYTYEPKYNFPGYKNMQFKPDGEVILNNDTILVIDNTTSARHDRFKQKQWDAFGVKEYFKEYHPNKTVIYYIVLPNKENLGRIDTREKEYNAFLREKTKFKDNDYFSTVDDIVDISELLYLIDNYS